MKKVPAYKLSKPIRLRLDKWQDVKDLADELSEERGSDYSLPDTISEAVKFYRENRPKINEVAGTPGSPGTEEQGHA